MTKNLVHVELTKEQHAFLMREALERRIAGRPNASLRAMVRDAVQKEINKMMSSAA